MSEFVHAGLLDLGRVREDNEDNWVACPDQGLYCVADGLGGQAGGGLASRIVVESLPLLVRNSLGDEPDPADRQTLVTLRAVLADLSNHLRSGSEGEPGLSGMGSTVVLVLVRGHDCAVAHMGDSRAYLFRDQHLARLTADHTLVRLLLESGDIAPEEVRTHPACGQLTRYVGMDGEPLPECRHVRLEIGDRILLCTDGLTNMISDAAIEQILQDAETPECGCKKLVAAANDAGGEDNICVVIIRCVGRDESHAADAGTRHHVS